MAKKCSCIVSILWLVAYSVLFLVLLIVRSDTYQPFTSPGMTCWTDGDDFHATVKIDVTFTEEEKDEIEAALDEWRDRTGNIVDLRIVGTVPHRAVLSPIFFASGIDVKFYRVNKYEALAWPKNIVGFTGFNAILVMASRLPNKREVYSVVLHEVGHLLQLEHSDDPHDLMYPFCSGNGCSEAAIGVGDLTNLCVEVNRLKRGTRKTGLR